MSLWRFFTVELKLVARSPMDILNPMMFAVLVSLMFPIGLGSSPQTLAKLAPGLIWVIVLLSSLLATDKLFKNDYSDGSLALWLLSPASSYLLVIGKVLHVIFAGRLLWSIIVMGCATGHFAVFLKGVS